LDALEAVAAHKVVITVPNRLFPHAHLDPTHVLRYRLGGLLGELNRSGRFAYSLHPLGFAEHWARRSWCRPLDGVARRAAGCPPNVLYLGGATGCGPEGAGCRPRPRPTSSPCSGSPTDGRPGWWWPWPPWPNLPAGSTTGGRPPPKRSPLTGPGGAGRRGPHGGP